MVINERAKKKEEILRKFDVIQKIIVELLDEDETYDEIYEYYETVRAIKMEIVSKSKFSKEDIILINKIYERMCKFEKYEGQFDIKSKLG